MISEGWKKDPELFEFLANIALIDPFKREYNWQRNPRQTALKAHLIPIHSDEINNPFKHSLKNPHLLQQTLPSMLEILPQKYHPTSEKENWFVKIEQIQTPFVIFLGAKLEDSV